MKIKELQIPFSAEKFVQSLNEARFDIQFVFREIKKLLKKALSSDTTVIKLKGLGDRIDLKDRKIVQKMLEFFSETSIVCSFLPEFFYHRKVNEFVVKKYGKQMSIAQNQTEFEEILKELNHDIPSENIAAYRFSGVAIPDVHQLLIFVLLTELMLELNKQQQTKTSQAAGGFHPMQALSSSDGIKSLRGINVEHEIQKMAQMNQREIGLVEERESFNEENDEFEQNINSGTQIEIHRKYSPEIGEIPSTIPMLQESPAANKTNIGGKMSSPIISSKAVNEHLLNSAKIDVAKYPSNSNIGLVALLDKAFASCLVAPLAQ